MLVVPLVLIAVSVGVLFYRRTQIAGRELELRRIQSDLAALARLRQNGTEGDLVAVPAKITPRRARR
ncbi:hypothetical protein HHI_05470 [Hyphomonas hirschiana VP5]|nr:MULTISPECIES: hypothetical protein [Hyphomonas]KCZ95580.1 hypothetical protein HHI_05470 [Hyphomonas hirschiana VP5]